MNHIISVGASPEAFPGNKEDDAEIVRQYLEKDPHSGSAKRPLDKWNRYNMTIHV
jgi:hypothetical protein